MTAKTAWIPTVVAVGALGLHWFIIRSMLQTHKKENAEKMDSLQKQIQAIQGEYMPVATHQLLCENNTLKIKQHFNDALEALKDDVFEYLRKIENCIKKR